MSARALGIGIAALMVLAALPVAGAVIGPPVSPPRDGIAGWNAGSHTTNTWCYAGDPAVGLISTSAGSYVEYAPAAGGKWRYTVHLTQLAPAAGCPANIDFSFTAAMAPWPQTFTSVPVTLHCGAIGSLQVYATDQSVYFWLYANFPSSCGAGITGNWGVGAEAHPLHPNLLSVCSPVGVVSGVSCVGPEEYRGQGTCPSGSTPGGTTIGLTSVHRECYDGERVVFYPVGLLVWFEFRQSSCTMRVQDPLVGVVDVTAGCPAQLAGFFWGSTWGNMLP